MQTFDDIMHLHFVGGVLHGRLEYISLLRVKKGVVVAYIYLKWAWYGLFCIKTTYLVALKVLYLTRDKGQWGGGGIVLLLQSRTKWEDGVSFSAIYMNYEKSMKCVLWRKPIYWLHGWWIMPT